MVTVAAFVEETPACAEDVPAFVEDVPACAEDAPAFADEEIGATLVWEAEAVGPDESASWVVVE